MSELKTSSLKRLIVKSVALLPLLWGTVLADTGRPGVNTAHGLNVYNKSCAYCHNEGRHGAPRLDDASEWKRRLFQGEEVLDQHVLSGHVKLMKHDKKAHLSDQDFIDAVHFMIVMLRDEPAR